MAGDNVDLTEYNGAPLVRACIFFLVMSWWAVSLRIYTRAVIINSLKMDDWLMLVSQAIFTASCAFIFEGVKKGMGRHNDAITDDDAKVAALKWQAVATITYILNMMFIKLSIGVFLLRLSVKTIYNYIIRTSLTIIVFWSLGIFVWDILQCMPVEKQWDYRITRGSVPRLGVLSLLLMLLALLPIPMLWSVKMSKQAKATVIVILGLGIFASIATLIRFRFLDTLQDSGDLLFSSTEAMIWTIIEPGVAIVASSLATIRPLLRAMKIHGFEADRTSSTITSSHARIISENRAVPCTIRKFGPNDISLKDIEAGYDSKAFDPPSKNAKCHDHEVESSQDSPSWHTHSTMDHSLDQYNYEETGHIGMGPRGVRKG
ncbi:hypothetical protein PT974_06685 [Cladobotryum mycophilum]|uniref:Rhodopsin domain-containing protein n=1 Tax=Cladobotryum mycophilum TaxID=491253 RepID=A0ABR0SN96_9HYPO